MSLVTNAQSVAPTQTYELVVLVATDHASLAAEHWQVSAQTYERLAARIDTAPTQNSRAQKLLSRLEPLLRSGRYELAYEHQWTDAEEMSDIHAKLNDRIASRDTLLGQVTTKSSNSARSNKTIVDLNLALLNIDEVTQAVAPVEETQWLLGEIEQLESPQALDELGLLPLQTNSHPFAPIVLAQRGAIDAGKLYYFDHPMLPTFMLLTEQETPDESSLDEQAVQVLGNE